MADPGAEAAAAKAAFEQFATEAWTLLAVALCITSLRTYARVRAVGIRGLKADDVLVWVAATLYCIETGLAYSVGAVAHGLANNDMTAQERAALSPDSPEYHARIIGSKIQLAGWSVYSTLLWVLKTSLLFFYMRLTAGLSRSYLVRIYVGFGFVGTSWIIVMSNLYLSCRPFHKNWQINPDPGNICYPAVSQQIVWVYLAFNITTDLFLLSIPVPMLWKSSLRPMKKIGLILLFSGGIFVVICATLRCILIVTDVKHGPQLAGSWAVRETFVATITTNLPMVFPLVRLVFSSALGSISSMRSSQKPDSRPSNLVTFGGGGANTPSWRGRGPPTANPIPNFTFSESEERMMDGVKMQNMKPTVQVDPECHVGGDAFRKQVEVDVISQDARPFDVEHQQPGLAHLAK
ncbi:hypothetical protein CDD81_472 [Ophiocordyceps australis]|uniref:Rhodopsin domain-containing protein n=1 Tax=Ophiocordyceps australis TaxID=1399860 RepID=A0A2C5XG34_9HYPO|nr:hypothetical protein CDD81_472 [Ophiocordyceps australis]